jgi:predicted TIM-barrel fold metal-dependent hydrolase
VLDHLAGITAALTAADPAWDALARLADRGAWIKLSGWYRLDAKAPYDALYAAIGRVAELFDDRMVWGSDWPHTAFAPGEAPDYASTFAPVLAALGAERARRVLQAGARLYG